MNVNLKKKHKRDKTTRYFLTFISFINIIVFPDHVKKKRDFLIIPFPIIISWAVKTNPWFFIIRSIEYSLHIQ